MTHQVVEVRVTEQSSPRFWTVFWVVAMIAVVISYIEWVLLFAAIAVGVFVAVVAVLRNRRRTAQLRANADRQLQRYLSGDPRWITGDTDAQGPQ